MSLTGLMKVLNDEKDIYANMLTLSEKKKDAITKGSVTELDSIVKAEQVLLVSITDIESKRRQATKELAYELNLDEGNMDLSAVLTKASDDEKQQVRLFQSEFKAILDKQSEINEVNRSLINTQLEYINFSIDAIRQTKADSNNYSADGAQAGKDSTRLGIFDAEI